MGKLFRETVQNIEIFWQKLGENMVETLAGFGKFEDDLEKL
jgi:hypothetical protein